MLIGSVLAGSGTTSNIEGRTTRVSQKVTVHGTARADWIIAADIAKRMGKDLGFASVDDVTAAISTHVDGYDHVTALELSIEPDGMVAVSSAIDPVNAPVVSLGDRNAYDYRLVVSRKLYDNAIGTAKSPSIAHLAAPSAVFVNPLDVARIGSAVGRDVKVSSARATVILPLATDASVQRGTAWVPFNQPGSVKIGDLIDANASVTDVRIESL